MITFRDAVEADLPAVVRLLADDRFGQGRERDETPLPESYARGFRATLTQGGRLILAEQERAVVGCLQFNVIHGVSQQGQSRAQVEGVRVDSARRGGGIGTALMRHAMAEARAAGCEVMQLTTNSERTEAQRFYTRLGFTHSHAGMKLALGNIPIKSSTKPSKFSSKIVILIALTLVFGIFIIVFGIYAAAFDIFCRHLTELSINTLGNFGPLLAAFSLGILAFFFTKFIFFFTLILYAMIEMYFGSVGAAVALLLLYRPD